MPGKDKKGRNVEKRDAKGRLQTNNGLSRVPGGVNAGAYAGDRRKYEANRTNRTYGPRSSCEIYVP